MPSSALAPAAAAPASDVAPAATAPAARRPPPRTRLDEVFDQKDDGTLIPIWKILAFLPIVFAVIYRLLPAPVSGVSPFKSVDDFEQAQAREKAMEEASPVGGYLANVGEVENFDLGEWTRSSQTVSCVATDHSGLFGPKEVDIELQYLDINPSASQTLLLVHGSHSSWSSWRNQIQTFSKDFRLIIPSLRGYGNSTAPKDPFMSSSVIELVKDLECVVKHAAVKSAPVCVGAALGAEICFESTFHSPGLVSAVAAHGYPHLPPQSDFPHAYEPKPADLEIEAHLHRLPFTSNRGIISKAEEAYWFESLARDFLTTLAVTSNINKRTSWFAARHKRDSHAISIPVLYMSTQTDALRVLLQPMEDLIPDLRFRKFASREWPQLETPDLYNGALKTFLEELAAEKK